jgi:SAM-dependent methyltransferase
MTDLKQLQRNWDALAKVDPLWAILASPENWRNRWDIDKFFETGVSEVDQILQHMWSLGLNPVRKKALDFGCGVGRLTQALAKHFEQVCGVDIAPSMIALAEQHNRYPEKCRYFVNESDDLKLFSDRSFDFIVSIIVLQHIEPSYSKKYIREFMRLLAPGGVLVMQVPSGRGRMIRTLSERLRHSVRPFLPERLLRLYRRLTLPAHIATDPCFHEAFSRMDMHAIPRAAIEQLLKASGGRIVEVLGSSAAGPDWLDFRYYVLKH